MAIRHVASAAIRSAGITGVCLGSHTFRHTLATDLLRHGASLDEIGETLRHKDASTTAIYAKVDLATLALVSADSLASGSTDLKLLNMHMLVPVHMSRFVEPELEDNVFASITSHVQAEGIQTLNVKGIRCREDNIRIDGHRHHCCVGSALKQIEITHVQAWILFRKYDGT
jgi:hypothetical protein